jgi:hypothetical protein
MEEAPINNKVDLIDDIWRRIFESLDYKLRIKLFQVSWADQPSQQIPRIY